MNLTGLCFTAMDSRSQIRQLVEPHFWKILHFWPFWFNLIRRFSNTTSLEISLGGWTCIICFLECFCPSLILFGLECPYLLNSASSISFLLSFHLIVKSCSSLGRLLESTFVPLRCITGLWFFNHLKFCIFCQFHQLSLLGFLLRDILGCFSDLSSWETLLSHDFTKLSKLFFFVIWLEQFTVELILEAVLARVLRTETLRLKI